jgi:hypothetical protein
VACGRRLFSSFAATMTDLDVAKLMPGRGQFVTVAPWSSCPRIAPSQPSCPVAGR